MGGISWGALISLALGGIILADILIHPAGTQAAANAASTIAKPTYNAMLGVSS